MARLNSLMHFGHDIHAFLSLCSRFSFLLSSVIVKTLLHYYGFNKGRSYGRVTYCLYEDTHWILHFERVVITIGMKSEFCL